ncbi:MAG TPA: hypothetical protein VMP67_03480 [Candidatus Limnocylindria bacterium]|nr:hypothetical protein [Candidatus Limnocylindria bacterium]
MTEPERNPPGPDDWPDEAGGGQAQDGLRQDVGSSQGRPREEDEAPPERVEEAGQRGPAGAGQVPGRGKLGSQTSTDEGVEAEG